MEEIDESQHRLKNSYDSYTFHGRDVYVFVAARLASGKIKFEEVGPKLDLKELVIFDTKDAYVKDGTIYGIIDVLDGRFGTPWTNITYEIMKEIGVDHNHLSDLHVVIKHNNEKVYDKVIPMLKSFGATEVGNELAFINSMMNLSFAINQGSFAEKNKVASGVDWTVEITKN